MLLPLTARACSGLWPDSETEQINALRGLRGFS
jgi:hypothetical protein